MTPGSGVRVGSGLPVVAENVVGGPELNVPTVVSAVDPSAPGRPPSPGARPVAGGLDGVTAVAAPGGGGEIAVGEPPAAPDPVVTAVGGVV